MNIFAKLVFGFGVASLVAACGGGGGGGDDAVTLVTPNTVTDGNSASGNTIGDVTAGPHFSFAISSAVAAKTTSEWQRYVRLQTVAALSPLNRIDNLVDATIPVMVDTCGRVNAFYDLRARSITLCDELYDELLRQSGDDNTTAIRIMNYILYHEIGHALIDVLNLPVVGNEESAADFFAGVIAGESGRSIAAVLGGIFLSSESTSYGDEHVGGEDRGGDIICLAVGSDSRLLFNSALSDRVSPFIDANRDCIAEYESQVAAVHLLIPGTMAINDNDIVHPEILALTDPNPVKNSDQSNNTTNDGNTTLTLVNNADEYWSCQFDGNDTIRVGYVFRANGTGLFVRVGGTNPIEAVYTWRTTAADQARLEYATFVENLTDIEFTGSHFLTMVSNTDGQLACLRRSLGN